MRIFSTLFRRLAFIAVTAAIAVTLSSCNSDSDHEYTYTVQEFATFVGNMGNASEFQVQRTGNGPVYNLYGAKRLNEQTLAPGTRVIIAYQIKNVSELPTSGEIDLLGVSAILNLSPVVVNMEADSVKNWNLNTISLEQIGRTGQYVNIMARAYCNQTELTRTFSLYADSASMTTDHPQLYLRYNRPTLENQEAYIPASINLGQIWQNPSYNGATVNIANSKDTSKTRFNFLKANESFTD